MLPAFILFTLWKRPAPQNLDLAHCRFWKGKTAGMLVRCDVCNAEFRRSEHLSRHILRHIGVRPFSCATCGADFSRRDSLQRHMQSHAEASSEANDSGPSKKSRRSCVPRACRNCARSKQRCDGRTPCARCKTRQRNCVYASENQHKARNFSESVALNADEAIDIHVTPESTDTHVHSESFSDIEESLDQQGHFTGTGMSGRNDQPLNPDSYHGFLWSTSHLGPPAFETSDSLFCTPTQWCFPTFDDRNWLNGTVSDDVWNGASQISDTLDTVQWSRRESDSFQERLPSSLLQDNSQLEASDSAANSQDAATGAGYQRVSSTEVATLPSDEAPRPVFTNHSELSSAFQDALGDPASLGGDCGKNAANVEARSRRQNRVVTDGLSYISRSSLLGRDPSNNLDNWRLEDYEHVPNLNPDVYGFISAQYTKLNADNGFYLPFTDQPIPSVEAFNAFVQSYFEHYHPVFPLLHQASFDPNHSHWVLIIAVAATGCGFSVLGTTSTSFILQELLRRSINLYICPQLFDSQICAYFDLPPTIPTDLLRLPMPSLDSLWMAQSSEEWNQELSGLSNLGKQKPLREQVNSFYKTKKIPEATSELNKILLTLAVYRDVGNGWDTASYLNLLRNDECQSHPATPLGWVALQHNHLVSILIHLSLRDLMAFSGWRLDTGSSYQRAS
ncbi:hypothetical protein CI238_06185 [Colletotrichum incanum]|uniref:Uncharacterized protein n=1 Tax=Colletotrichum incanum TaxID=1573173 RepID=A0A161Y8M5_COLIC|nr:hypothetical protein CI238_06185 [Colletotrichum incanum]